MSGTRIFLRIALLGAVIAVAGCAAKQPYSEVEGPRGAFGPTVLTVRNDNWLDMRIYVVADNGGRPFRVGVVPSYTSARIELPIPITGSARLLLRPIGSRAEHLTNPVYVSGGGSLDLVIHNALNHSILSLR